MNNLKPIRHLLHKTQKAIAEAIGISRGLWSVHEAKPDDFDAPPHIARKLIAYAKTLGVPLTYEHLYEDAPLPVMKMVPVKKATPAKRVRRPKVVAAAQLPTSEPAKVKRARRPIVVA